MSTELEKLFKTEQEIQQDILADFAFELFRELEKLAEVYGKENFINMVLEK